MHIFVDLDGTLFDTPKLGADTAALLENELHIDPRVYESARQEMFSMNNKVYSAELHARRLARLAHVPEGELVKKFINLFNSEKSVTYVYPDAIDFLKKASQLGNVYILTFGESFVETPRIYKSGLRELVTDAVVTHNNKAAAIEQFLQPEIINNKDICLIDDSIEHLDNIKTRFPESVTIHLDRNSKNIPTEHYRATSLSQALEILKKIMED